jgi:hypothetical protein
MEPVVLPKGQVWELPPIILHPFSDPEGPDKLVESSRAHLMEQGLLPTGQLSEGEIHSRLLEGRYCEIRMLFYVGKDLDRWLAQCLETAQRDPLLRAQNLNNGSFINLLVDHPPLNVREKLTRWGVADYRAIFMRALGLNAVFEEVPPREVLADHFIRFYYRYADQLFRARLTSELLRPAPPENFHYELYASGEYSRLLEREWE